MDRKAVLLAMDAIRDCALAMMGNASYIQQELPRVEMTGELRSRTAEICESMVGTKHDVIHELFAVDVLLESKAGQTTVQSRIDLILGWLWEDIARMHELVLALREDSRQNDDFVLALVLVQESGANIINAFNGAKAAADALPSQKN